MAVADQQGPEGARWNLGPMGGLSFYIGLSLSVMWPSSCHQTYFSISSSETRMVAVGPKLLWGMG